MPLTRHRGRGRPRPPHCTIPRYPHTPLPLPYKWVLVDRDLTQAKKIPTPDLQRVGKGFFCLADSNNFSMAPLRAAPPPDIKLMKARRDGVYICVRMHSVLTHEAHRPPVAAVVAEPALPRAGVQSVAAVLVARRGRPVAAGTAHKVDLATPSVARSGEEHRPAI